MQWRRKPKKKENTNRRKRIDEKESWCELLNVSNISYKP